MIYLNKSFNRFLLQSFLLLQAALFPPINSGDVPYIKYYSLPFKRSADILGGVERKNYNYTDGGKGETFIEDTINKDVENIKSFFNMFIDFFYKCNVRCNLPF